MVVRDVANSLNKVGHWRKISEKSCLAGEYCHLSGGVLIRTLAVSEKNLPTFKVLTDNAFFSNLSTRNLKVVFDSSIDGN